MRKACIALLVLGLALVFSNQWRLTQQIKTLETERDAALQTEPQRTPQSSDADLRATREKLEQANSELAAAHKKLGELETRIAAMDHKPADSSPANSVSAITIGASPPPAPDTANPLKRSWGPEQAAGPPDTLNAGDIPTAWASLEPNAGMEWLKLDYQTVVNVAQIRIRETLNPGAVVKITALSPTGQEFTLWQGIETTGPAPYDSVFDVPAGMYSQSIKIYLDSARVPGWNEIDAVELIARDGFRQWASTASASTTYADRTTTPVASSRLLIEQ